MYMKFSFSHLISPQREGGTRRPLSAPGVREIAQVLALSAKCVSPGIRPAFHTASPFFHFYSVLTYFTKGIIRISSMLCVRLRSQTSNFANWEMRYRPQWTVMETKYEDRKDRNSHNRFFLESILWPLSHHPKSHF